MLPRSPFQTISDRIRHADDGVRSQGSLCHVSDEHSDNGQVVLRVLGFSPVRISPSMFLCHVKRLLPEGQMGQAREPPKNAGSDSFYQPDAQILYFNIFITLL